MTPERRAVALQTRAQVGGIALGADYPRAGVEVAALGLEGFFGGQHFHVFQFETESGQRVVGVGVDQVDGGGAAGDAAGRFGVGGHQRHGRLQDGGFGDPHGGDVVQRAQRPAGIVIRRRIVDVVVLRVEQHVGAAAVGLVHADHVAAGGELAAGGVQPVDLDALQAQLIHQLGGLAGARIAGRGAPTRRALRR